MVKTIIKIEGMACGMCESHMNDAIRNAFQIKKVSSSHVDKESVVISEQALDETEVKKVVEDTGYTFVSLSSEPYEKKGLFSFRK
ncbi:MAG: heavy-metal-associated domain-containing protein [Eubacterium sp.]|nr:heavy-metal-associated domain-containing protein [Eubacterium sp.]